jgi:hypothetical protein
MEGFQLEAVADRGGVAQHPAAAALAAATVAAPPGRPDAPRSAGLTTNTAFCPPDRTETGCASIPQPAGRGRSIVELWVPAEELTDLSPSFRVRRPDPEDAGSHAPRWRRWRGGMHGQGCSARVAAVGAGECGTRGVGAVVRALPRLLRGRGTLLLPGRPADPVGCCMHAFIDSIQRVLSLAGLLRIEYPPTVGLDRPPGRRSAGPFFNEPWFLLEGLGFGALGWVALGSGRDRGCAPCVSRVR